MIRSILVLYVLCFLALVHAAPIARRSSYSGTATWYNPGLGSCGETNGNSDLVVALSASVMSKSYCGKSIQISSGSKSVAVTVADTCPGCDANQIDLGMAAFAKLADLGTGVIKASWSLA